MTLASHLEGRDNNLNLIRIVAAAAVLISHAFPITMGADTVQPLEKQIGLTLGAVAVYVFFIISGFLIPRSFERRSFPDFVMARFLRLFPGLAVVLLLTVLFLGPLATSLSLNDYISNPKTFAYFPRNLLLASLQYDLPGVFAAMPYPSAINGSLWSLFPEVMCYAGVVVLGLGGLLADGRRFSAAIILFALFYSLVHYFPVGWPGYERLQTLAHMSFPFFVGTTIYKFRDWLPLTGMAALACVVGMAFVKWLYFPFEIFCILCAYVVLYLAFVPSGAVRSYNRLGDYSYGVYIYAFPMQQLSVFWLGPMAPVTNIAIAGTLTLCFAVLSWHFVEKPSLRFRRVLSTWLGATQPLETVRRKLRQAFQ